MAPFGHSSHSITGNNQEEDTHKHTHMPACTNASANIQEAASPSSSQLSAVNPSIPTPTRFHPLARPSPSLSPRLTHPHLHAHTHTQTYSTKLLEPLACQGGKMALQPSSQSDSLARTGDHKPADPASVVCSSGNIWTPSQHRQSSSADLGRGGLGRRRDVRRNIRCDYVEPTVKKGRNNEDEDLKSSFSGDAGFNTAKTEALEK